MSDRFDDPARLDAALHELDARASGRASTASDADLARGALGLVRARRVRRRGAVVATTAALLAAFATTRLRSSGEGAPAATTTVEVASGRDVGDGPHATGSVRPAVADDSATEVAFPDVAALLAATEDALARLTGERRLHEARRGRALPGVRAEVEDHARWVALRWRARSEDLRADGDLAAADALAARLRATFPADRDLENHPGATEAPGADPDRTEDLR